MKNAPETILTPRQVERLARWSPKRQKLVKSLYQGVASPRMAIKAHCLECVGEDLDALRECADNCCPLFQFRPFRKCPAGTTKNKNQNAATNTRPETP